MKFPSVELGKVADFINGHAFKPEDWQTTGKKIIRIQNLSDKKKPFNRTNKNVDSRYIVSHGTILVSWSATLDVFEWNDNEPAFLNQHIFKVIPNDQLIIKSFLKRVLKRAISDMLCYTHGSTMKHINRREFLETKIPLPPLEEQKRIAAILDKADAIRRKRKKAIALTEELLRSTFLDMFGDPVTNPKGWDEVFLGDISKVQGGLQVTSKRKDHPLEIPYLRVANVYRDHLVLDEIKTIRVTQQEAERTYLQIGDLLIVEWHGNSTEIGRSSVWDGSISNCTHQNHLIRVRTNHTKADSIYVSTFLNSPGGRRQLNKFGKTTSGLNTISTSNVKATKILLPPLSEQEKFLKIRAIIINSLNNHHRYFANLDDLFNSLLQKAFRGEL